jgi:IS605 OrfB family transposase
VGRSSGVMTTVKVPIRWDVMTDRQKTRLSRITSRDTRVIKAYLGVIERHERDLLAGKDKKQLDAGKLDELTLRTELRDVPHDFKTRFPNISTNELQECRETAMAMWKVYLALGRNKPLQAKGYSSRKLPRHMFTRMFEFVYTPEKAIKHWLILRDSLNSVREGRKHHDRLAVPLSPSSYHLNQLKLGEKKSIQIVKDRNRKWWVLFKVKVDVTIEKATSKPPAVIGIDLGIKKAVCSVVLTQNGLRQVRFWTDNEKASQIERYDRMVASLQFERDTRLKNSQSTDEVTKRLRTISSKRENISFDYDGKLVKQLSEHILQLAEEYDLFIAIGQLKGIRNRARKGNGKGPRFRGMINRWSFARITTSLQHKLSLNGFDSRRVFAVPEAWTSIKCHKCGSTGYRPKQSYFLCHTCGYRDNADKNAAINIALRFIRLIPSLRGEKGLGNWLPSIRKASPKTRRARPKGVSSVPKKSPASPVGSAVADCYNQTSLEEFASSADQAMKKTMETPSAVISSGGHDNILQRTETQSVKRNHISMSRSETHAPPAGEVLLVAGDSSHEGVEHGS